MRKIQQTYEVGGELLDIKNFYANSKKCVKIRDEKSVWFEIKQGLGQWCGMSSSWLFNIFMNRILKATRVMFR